MSKVAIRVITHVSLFKYTKTYLYQIVHPLLYHAQQVVHGPICHTGAQNLLIHRFVIARNLHIKKQFINVGKKGADREGLYVSQDVH